MSLLKRWALVLVLAAMAVPMVGCGSGGSDDYDPDKIAKPQPGNGPPPMNQPASPPKTKG